MYTSKAHFFSKISYRNLRKLPSGSRHSTEAAGAHVPFVLPFSAGGHLTSHIVALSGHIVLDSLSDTCGSIKAKTFYPVDPDMWYDGEMPQSFAVIAMVAVKV